ncbi:universal stress protein [uncultured Microbacterium sp.]|uniref:universal stress protein n=1 Tax=uncultured Microbacterium sp. TaxID=191216 RepID=UPI0028ED6289|nr:universal stress protein [uncultured Microbacterium sp.]
MQESILVGVVDTPASRRAVEWAAHRANERLSRVELLSVVGGAIGTVGEGAVVAEAISLTQTLLEREAERVRARGVKGTPWSREETRWTN